jgi:ABC-type multidrug transport system ATPase subunit
MPILGLSPLLLPPAPLSARGITKGFARGLARSPRRISAIESIDLDVYPGELIALVGGEAAGKTTLLQCLAGLLKPDAGKVTLFGEGFPSGWTPPGLAYVAATPVFYPFLTPRDVVELAIARNPEPAAVRHGADELLASLELNAVRATRIACLSREIVQRVSIAHALASQPAVILADSSPSPSAVPFDAVTVRVLAARAGEGAAVILAARDVSAVAFAATRLFLMENGRTARTFAIESYGEPIVAGLPAGARRIVAERVH